MSYNHKINFGKYDWKKYLLRHINITIARTNFVLLKQEFSHLGFLAERVETKPGKSECLYSQCWYLLKIFDHYVARIALFWNDDVLSAYRIAFAVERKRGRKQRTILHPKTQSILFQNSSFSKKQNQIPVRILGSRDLTCISPWIKCHYNEQ